MTRQRRRASRSRHHHTITPTQDNDHAQLTHKLGAFFHNCSLGTYFFNNGTIPHNKKAVH